MLKHSPMGTEDRKAKMANPQLRLVQDAQQPQTTTDPVRRIFVHWMFMHGKSPARCRLTPDRSQPIAAALAMGYCVEDLLLAVEGHASDPMDWARSDDSRKRFRELDKLMARGSTIERYIELGEALRDAAGRQLAPVVATEMVAEPVDPVAAAAARERLRTLAASLRGGHHG